MSILLLLLIIASANLAGAFFGARIQSQSPNVVKMSSASEGGRNLWKSIPLALAIFTTAPTLVLPIAAHATTSSTKNSDPQLKNTLKAYEAALDAKNNPPPAPAAPAATTVPDATKTVSQKPAAAAPVVKTPAAVKPAPAAVKPAPAAVKATPPPAVATPAVPKAATKVVQKDLRLKEEIAVDGAIEKRNVGQLRTRFLEDQSVTMRKSLGATQNDLKRVESKIAQIDNKIKNSRRLTIDEERVLNIAKAPLMKDAQALRVKLNSADTTIARNGQELLSLKKRLVADEANIKSRQQDVVRRKAQIALQAKEEAKQKISKEISALKTKERREESATKSAVKESKKLKDDISKLATLQQKENDEERDISKIVSSLERDLSSAKGRLAKSADRATATKASIAGAKAKLASTEAEVKADITATNELSSKIETLKKKL